jgi:O-antigen/teichoic acid export membrane protein
MNLISERCSVSLIIKKSGKILSKKEDKPNEDGRVAKAIFNYGLGSLLPQIIGFLLIPLYTQYLTPTEMGIVEICLTVQGLLPIMMRLGLQGAIARFYFDYDEGQNLRDLVTTITITTIVASALLMVVTLFAAPFFLRRFLPEVPFGLMALSIISCFFQGAPELQRRLLQAREQSAYSAKLNISFGLLAIVLNLSLVIIFKMGAAGILWANLIVPVVMCVVAFVNQRDDLRGRFRFEQLKPALQYGLPLLPHHVAAWAHQFVGRWVLGSVATVAMVGHLSLAGKIASPIFVVTGAFANAYSPVYFSWRARLSNNEALAQAKHIARMVLILGVIAVIGAATFGGFVVRHLIQKSYAEAAPLVGVMAAAFFAHLVYTALAVEIFYTKSLVKWISVIFVSSSLINFILIFFLVSKYGAVAAAYAQMAGSVVSIILVSVFSSRTFALPLDWRACVVALSGTIASCFVSALQPPTNVWSDLAFSSIIFFVLTTLVLFLSGVLPQLRADLTGLLQNRFRRSVA